MVTRPIATIVICTGIFLILQAFIPKVIAFRNPASVDRFMKEGHRNYKRKNYMVQGTSDNEIMGNIENDRNPEELSAFIVDYANMIRNDVILLDKSVETRTRKRGNLKVEKYNNQVIPDPPCGCSPNVVYEDLGEDVFPRNIEIRNCSTNNSCRQPYTCENNLYNLTILKKKTRTRNMSENIKIHTNLSNNWYAVQLPISVGCECKLSYVTEI